MTMPPELLREDAANIECGTIINRAQVAKDYRAHADALERIKDLEDGARALFKQLDERDAEIARLKGHAEAMAKAHALSNYDYKGAFAAYRAAYKDPT